jgi:uncharacterized membrane protein YhaH (DUF805 family)
MTQLLFSFDGRIRRLHYWLVSLGVGFGLSTVYLGVFSITEATASAAAGGDARAAMSSPAMVIAMLVLTLIYLTLAIWIGLAVQVKRWHDRDKSGWWVLTGFIPIVGGIWSLIECGILDGTPGPNRFGLSPKGVTGPPPVRI